MGRSVDLLEMWRMGYASSTSVLVIHTYIKSTNSDNELSITGFFPTDVRDKVSILLREPLLLKRSVRRSTQTETWIPRNARIHRALLRPEVMYAYSIRYKIRSELDRRDRDPVVLCYPRSL
jgi:hypothetical protein